VKFSIRAYRPPDFDTLLAIDRACYAPEIAYSRREMRAYLNLPGANCLLATSGKRIIGFVLTVRDDDFGHIITMDVLARYRRAGVASALLRRAEKPLAAAKVREAWLETAIDNEAAIAFWQKHGYRTRGRLNRYYPGGLDALAMSKPLAKAAAQES
jgi:[ribosomal protein S18]-alanine N-acetyltransferase